MLKLRISYFEIVKISQASITKALNVRENIKQKTNLDLIGKFVSVGNMTLYGICKG